MNNNSYKIISYLSVLASLFIVVLFTKDLIFNMQANLDEKTSKQQEVEKKRLEYKKLTEVKAKLSKNKDSEISKYNFSLNEDEIVDYIYSMIEDGNISKGPKKSLGLSYVDSINISKPEKNELGFLQSNLTINLKVENEARLKIILDYLLGEKSKYKFFINSLSYEINENDDTSGPRDSKSLFPVSIPLKIFYK